MENRESKSVSGTSGTLSQEMKSGFIYLRAAFRASPSPKLDEGKEREMTASSGHRCLGLFGSLDRDGSLVKMLRDYLLFSKAWYSNKCALIWKEKVTPFRRSLFQLSPSMRRTEETGSGLLPTTSAQERGAHTGKYAGTTDGKSRISAKGVKYGATLQTAIRMLPTPRAREGNSGDGEAGIKHGLKKGYLDAKIATLPTPSARDWKGESARNIQVPNIVGTRTGLKLHSDFASWMMGYPINWLDL
jgi:hypothetical protein